MPKTTINTDQIRDASVTESKLSFSDVTTGDVSQTQHGLMPKLTGYDEQYLSGTGTWVYNEKLRFANGIDESYYLTGRWVTNIVVDAGNVYDLLYIKSNGNWGQAIATSAATSLVTGIRGQDTNQVYMPGSLALLMSTGGSWTAGDLLYLSDSVAGGITTTAPTGTGKFVVVVGVALGANKMIFNPSLVTMELT